MSKKKINKAFEARNRYNNKENEEFVIHILRNKLAYMLELFFGKFFWECMAGSAVGMGLYFINPDFYGYPVIAFAALFVFAWLVKVVVGLWFYKYSKNVVLTNQGFWVMEMSLFWWSKGFDEKKHMFSAYWNFYEWYEIKNLNYDNNFFSNKLKITNLKWKRFDGTHEIKYLEPNDAEKIKETCDFYKKNKKKKTAALSVDFENIFKIVKQSIDKWDCLGLLERGSPEDEYDDEITQIAKLAGSTNNVRKLTYHILETFKMDNDIFTFENARPVAKEIIENKANIITRLIPKE